MRFVTLCRFKVKPTKQVIDEINRLMDQISKEGGKFLSVDWTLGRYDAVVTFEGADVKSVMQGLLRFSHLLSTETLVAVPGSEAVNLVQ